MKIFEDLKELIINSNPVIESYDISNDNKGNEWITYTIKEKDGTLSNHTVSDNLSLNTSLGSVVYQHGRLESLLASHTKITYNDLKQLIINSESVIHSHTTIHQEPSNTEWLTYTYKNNEGYMVTRTVSENSFPDNIAHHYNTIKNRLISNTKEHQSFYDLLSLVKEYNTEHNIVTEYEYGCGDSLSFLLKRYSQVHNVGIKDYAKIITLYNYLVDDIEYYYGRVNRFMDLCILVRDNYPRYIESYKVINYDSSVSNIDTLYFTMGGISYEVCYTEFNEIQRLYDLVYDGVTPDVTIEEIVVDKKNDEERKKIMNGNTFEDLKRLVVTSDSVIVSYDVDTSNLKYEVLSYRLKESDNVINKYEVRSTDAIGVITSNYKHVEKIRVAHLHRYPLFYDLVDLVKHYYPNIVDSFKHDKNVNGDTLWFTLSSDGSTYKVGITNEDEILMLYRFIMEDVDTQGDGYKYYHSYDDLVSLVKDHNTRCIKSYSIVDDGNDQHINFYLRGVNEGECYNVRSTQFELIQELYDLVSEGSVSEGLEEIVVDKKFSDIVSLIQNGFVPMGMIKEYSLKQDGGRLTLYVSTLSGDEYTLSSKDKLLFNGYYELFEGLVK